MKKTALVLFVFCCFTKADACDICGCGVGSNYIGILPEFHKHIFGVRYRYNSLQTHLGISGASTYLTTAENYHTAELWGGWSIGKKFRAMITVPYGFNERNNQGISKNKNGLGDISVVGYYELLNNKKAVGRKKLLVQILWIGAGIKLPTGKYIAAGKQNTTQNTNLFQLGTGSVDFTLNTMYDIRLQDAGLNISAGYKINRANKYNYIYGNKLNSVAQLYYKFRIKNKFIVAPNAGIMFEQSQKDLDNKISVYASGGNFLAATVGVETAFKRIAVGANWQTPLKQNLARNFVKANNRVMLHMSFLL